MKHTPNPLPMETVAEGRVYWVAPALIFINLGHLHRRAQHQRFRLSRCCGDRDRAVVIATRIHAIRVTRTRLKQALNMVH